MLKNEKRMPSSKHEQKTHFHTYTRSHSIKKKHSLTHTLWSYSTALWINTLRLLSWASRRKLIAWNWDFQLKLKPVNTQGYKIQLYRVQSCQMKCNHRVWSVVVTMINNRFSHCEIIFNGYNSSVHIHSIPRVRYFQIWGQTSHFILNSCQK